MYTLLFCYSFKIRKKVKIHSTLIHIVINSIGIFSIQEINGLCNGFCLWYGSYIFSSSSGRCGFLLLVIYLLLAMLLQFFSLLVTLLVGPWSHLHCVFSDCFLCSLIFMVLWYSMFTVVFVVFILHCCSVYHIFITSPFILRKVTRRLLSYFSFLKKLFLRILEDLVSRKWSI